jgi:hypothetical protein
LAIAFAKGDALTLPSVELLFVIGVLLFNIIGVITVAVVSFFS